MVPLMVLPSTSLRKCWSLETMPAVRWFCTRLTSSSTLGSSPSLYEVITCKGAGELRWRRCLLWRHLLRALASRTAALLATAGRLEGTEELGGGRLEGLLAAEDRVDRQVDRRRLHRPVAGGDGVALERLASEGELGAGQRHAPLDVREDLLGGPGQHGADGEAVERALGRLVGVR
eukprot:scaffold23268_cov67-Phaeocystis_antarctica.AAC.1